MLFTNRSRIKERLDYCICLQCAILSGGARSLQQLSVAILVAAGRSHHTLRAVEHMPPKSGDDDGDRDTFSGSVDELAAVLAPYARQNGTLICTYRDESKACSEAKLVHGDDGVEGNHKLLHDLWKLQSNLSFQKKKRKMP